MTNTLLTTDSKSSTDSTAGTSTGSYLIPRTLYGSLFKAMRRNLVMSALAAKRIGPESIPGSSIDIPMQKAGQTMYLSRVEQGDEIPLDVEEYSGFNLKPIKYGIRIGITEEMVEDSLFDVMSLNVETAGYIFALNEESLIVSTLDAGSTAAGHDVANSNATLPITDITEAMQNLEEDNHIATDIIVGAEVANDLRNIDTFTEANKAGMNDPSKRLIGKIFQMNVIQSNAVSAKLAYVIDRRFAFVIAEKRPLRIEKYKDYGRDTRYAVATQRIAVRYLYENAISEITTT